MTTTVRDVMSTDLVTVEPSTMMTEAAAAMSSARVGSVLVLEEGALVGLHRARHPLGLRAVPCRPGPRVPRVQGHDLEPSDDRPRRHRG